MPHSAAQDVGFGPERTSHSREHAVMLAKRYLLVHDMVGKFLTRGAIVDTIKSEERTNALQRRAGKIRYHVDVISCGCPDENCGAFHVLRTERPLPTIAEAEATLHADRRSRKHRH